MIYEVNNTFGGRHSYVLPVDGAAVQKTAKRFFVSPFNAVEGDYGFRFTVPALRMALGITLRVKGEPTLKAYASGTRLALTDRNLLRLFLTVPILTVKVTAAIHLEALRLWLKGLRPVRRPAPAPPVVEFICRMDGAP
jgi:DUF1365 family protein